MTIIILVSVRVSKEAVDRGHDLWGLVSDKFPEEMLTVLLSLLKVLQHSCSPFFLVNPETEGHRNSFTA